MLALQNPGEFTVQNNRIQPAQDGRGADSANSHQALTACCTAIVSWELADETVLIDVDCVKLHCALVQPRVGSVEPQICLHRQPKPIDCEGQLQ